MRWYKFSIVLAIGLLVELIVAIPSSILIKENGEWLAGMVLPYFAPHSPLFFGAMMEVIYLSAVFSLALYAKTRSDLPKGIVLTVLEGLSEIVTLLFFFKFTYEITSFFLATAALGLSLHNTGVFLSKSDPAGFARFPSLISKIYLWTVLYCILSINFA
ncbi:MAG: hypothetical protein J5765_03825 [Clostridia bacterium]|nr:hypothetical protein [Clostridia bacterium]